MNNIKGNAIIGQSGGPTAAINATLAGVIKGALEAPQIDRIYGAVNGIAAIGIYFTTDGGNPFVGPAPTGIIGMIPFIITAVLMTVNLIRHRK